MCLVANYVVSFSLDLLPLAHKPHILLCGAFGMVACRIVSPLASLAGRRCRSDVNVI